MLPRFWCFTIVVEGRTTSGPQTPAHKPYQTDVSSESWPAKVLNTSVALRGSLSSLRRLPTAGFHSKTPKGFEKECVGPLLYFRTISLLHGIVPLQTRALAWMFSFTDMASESGPGGGGGNFDAFTPCHLVDPRNSLPCGSRDEARVSPMCTKTSGRIQPPIVPSCYVFSSSSFCVFPRSHVDVCSSATDSSRPRCVERLPMLRRRRAVAAPLRLLACLRSWRKGRRDPSPGVSSRRGRTSACSRDEPRAHGPFDNFSFPWMHISRNSVRIGTVPAARALRAATSSVRPSRIRRGKRPPFVGGLSGSARVRFPPRSPTRRFVVSAPFEPGGRSGSTRFGLPFRSRGEPEQTRSRVAPWPESAVTKMRGRVAEDPAHVAHGWLEWWEANS